MMQVNTINGIAYITIGDSSYTLPESLEGLLENDELLGKLTMMEVFELLRSHAGIPNNFDQYLIRKIKIYGNSLEVSSFICEGNKVWLDKEQRASILNLLNLESKDIDRENFELVLHDKVHVLSAEKLKDLISKLEVYSYKCLVNTTKHLQNIENLKTMRDILTYDYTTGYPNKIILE